MIEIVALAFGGLMLIGAIVFLIAIVKGFG